MIFLLPPGKNYTIVGNNPDGFPNNFSDHDTTDDCDASDADTAVDSIAIIKTMVDKQFLLLTFLID